MAGATPLGLESTVIGFDGDMPVLLRPGAIAREEIEAVIGPLAQAGRRHPSPGQLESHYAPRAALRLNAREHDRGRSVAGLRAVARTRR